MQEQTPIPKKRKKLQSKPVAKPSGNNPYQNIPVKNNSSGFNFPGAVM